MKKINETKNGLVFQADMNYTLANAIRRYLGKIKVLAIDELEISKNDSPLYDETIAHRLGLVPIVTPGNVSDSTEKELTLQSKKEGFVSSGEFKGSAKVVYENIPITLLSKGQELNVKAFIRAGKGNDHAKFSPGLMFYNELMDVKLKNCPLEAVDICPKGILENKDGKVIVNEKAKYKGDTCEACVDALKKIGKENCIEVKPQGELVINLESFGQLSTKDMFINSIKELKKDLEEVGKGLK